jgi:hypothetical protein
MDRWTVSQNVRPWWRLQGWSFSSCELRSYMSSHCPYFLRQTPSLWCPEVWRPCLHTQYLVFY